MSMWLSKFNNWENSSNLFNDAEKSSIASIATLCSQTITKSSQRVVVEQQSNGISEGKVIDTSKDFLEIYSKIEKEMESSQDEIYTRKIQSLERNKEYLQKAIDQVKEADKKLVSMKEKYEFVKNKTNGLQTACENLLEEQRHMVGVTDDLRHKLTYFTHFQTVSQMLNVSGEDLVLDPEFIPMLTKLDQCIAFISAHENYKQSDVYSMRYRQAMTRSLTLIKLYFVNEIRQLHTDIKQKLNNRGGNSPEKSQLALLNARFKNLSAKVQPLIGELELRCMGHQEYHGLLKDCIMSYLNARKSLLGPVISDKVQPQMAEVSLLEMTTTTSAYILQLSKDEYKLFRNFFTLGEHEVRSFFEFLGESFNRNLKIFIAKEERIDVISEISSELLFLVKGTTDSDYSIATTAVENLISFCQERLCRKAADLIVNEIRGFRPKELELRFLARGPGFPQPAQVSSSVTVAEVLGLPSHTSLNQISSLSPKPELTPLDDPAIGGGEWYPAVQKTINLLSKLFDIVPEAKFEELGQDAVEACRYSISLTAKMLKIHYSAVDGDLFTIKNLMQIREHISYYHCNFSRPQRTTSIIDMFIGLGDYVLDNPPKAKIEYEDVRMNLDHDLRNACENFIKITSNSATVNITNFMQSVDSKKRDKAKDAIPPEEFKRVFELEKNGFETSLMASFIKMKQYLGDRNTQLTLIRIIRNSIISSFVEYLDFASKNGAAEIGLETSVADSLDAVIAQLDV